MEGTAKRRKCSIHLSDQQREQLLEVTRDGATRSKRYIHARALLMADEAHPRASVAMRYIGRALGIAAKTVARIRYKFVGGGLAVALERKKRMVGPIQPVIDGKAEAQLVALCCSAPPPGWAHWSMSLLADTMVKRKIVVSVCKETVRKCLKKRIEALAGQTLLHSRTRPRPLRRADGAGAGPVRPAARCA